MSRSGSASTLLDGGGRTAAPTAGSFAEKLLIEKGDTATIDHPAVMKGFDAFANVLCITPADVATRIQGALARISSMRRRARWRA